MEGEPVLSILAVRIKFIIITITAVRMNTVCIVRFNNNNNRINNYLMMSITKTFKIEDNNNS